MSMKIRYIKTSPVSSSFRTRLLLLVNISNSIIQTTIITHLNNSNSLITGLSASNILPSPANLPNSSKMIFQKANVLKIFHSFYFHLEYIRSPHQFLWFHIQHSPPLSTMLQLPCSSFNSSNTPTSFLTQSLVLLLPGIVFFQMFT